MLTISNTTEGYLKNVEIKGNTVQNPTNLADIKSVGKKLDNQELYEIPLLSCGKNLFDGKLELGGIEDSGNVNVASLKRCVGYIKVKPNSQYKLSFSGGESSANVRFYDKDKKHVKYAGYVNSFVTTSETMYVRFYNGGTDLNINIQLEEGTTVTPYEPFQSNKITILSPIQLEKVGDIADRIIQKDGVWGVEKNVVDGVLDGTGSYDTFVSQSNGIKRIGFNSLSSKIRIGSTLICNNRKGILWKDNPWTSTVDSISVQEGLGLIYIYTKTDSINSVAEYQNYLKQNNSIIKYVTNNPQFIPLPQDQQILLKTFDNKTNISFLTEIEGTVKAQAPKSMKATVSTHTSQIENIYDELDRVKKLEESTVSTVTTDKDFTNVQATSQGYFEDVKLQGKTLVNLAIGKYERTLVKNGSLEVNVSKSMLVSGKTYTFVTHCTVANSYGANIIVSYKDGTNSRIINSALKDNHVVTFTVENKEIDKILWWGWSANADNATCNLSNLMIFEGDLTENSPSDYIEGLKSVGDGVDEIVVSSVKGDLIEFELGSFVEGIPSDANNRFRAKNFFKCNGLKTDMLNVDYSKFDIGFMFYDIDKKYINATNWVSSNQNVPSGSYYFKIVIKKKNNEIIISDDMKNCKAYQESKADKKRILYYDTTDNTWKKPTLREWDTIEKHADGKYYYHQRSLEYVLNGSETCNETTSLDELSGTGLYATFRFVNLLGKEYITPNICDKIASVTFDKFKEFKNECISIDSYGISIKILKSKLETPDLAGFKKWLQVNNVTVVYQLAQEKVFECTNIDLITYANETNYVFAGGVISPRTSLKVQNNISNVVSTIQKKVSLMENYVTSMLRAVLAGDMRAVAQTLYPNDFTHESVPMVDVSTETVEK